MKASYLEVTSGLGNRKRKPKVVAPHQSLLDICPFSPSSIHLFLVSASANNLQFRVYGMSFHEDLFLVQNVLLSTA